MRAGISAAGGSILERCAKQLGRAGQRSFAGSVRLAPSMSRLRSGSAIDTLLEQLNRSGRALAQGLQAAGELPPLTPTSATSGSKRRTRDLLVRCTQMEASPSGPDVDVRLIRQESQFNQSVSSADALGLMQIIPPTAKQIARWLRIRNPSRKSMLEPNLNIRLGSRYLAYLLKRYRGRVAHASPPTTQGRCASIAGKAPSRSPNR